MSAGKSMVPKWVEAVIERAEGWRKSPQMFLQPSWEESYQRWHFSKLSQWRVWMHIVFSAALVGLVFNFFKLLQIGPSLDLFSVLCLGAAPSSVILMYFFAMELMLRAISNSAKTQGSWDMQPQIMQSVHLLSIAIACELWLRMDSEANTVELALRWVATCPLAFATFEANCVWYSLVLGLRPVYAASCTGRLPDSKADQFLAVIAIVGVIVMFFVFRARRAEWIRALATTSVFNASYIPPTHSVLSNQSLLKDGETKMHDDYFTEEEWSGLRAEVEEEGAEMLKRSAYGPGVGRHQGLVPYEWVHGEAVLGHGTYGKVVVVKSSVTGEVCALKRVPARPAQPTSEPERHQSHEKQWRTEGMLLRMLRHPNVVAFVDELELEGETQLVMELCSGGSLATLIHNFGPLGDPSAAWLSRCIVRALKYLHQHGISHMDLKPANCLLSPTAARDVVLKLCDFGASGFKQGPPEKVCGTPSYLAPELLRDKTVLSRRKMDIWSLGVCTLEMLTGQVLKLDPPPGAPRSSSDASSDSTTDSPRPDAGARSVTDYIRALRALRSDPRLPFPPPASAHASFVQACLRVDPRQRPTAQALEGHAFVAASARCPREAKAMAAVLERAAVEWEDIAPVSDYRKLWPRMRRKARSLLSLAGLWQALLDLDPPFHSPALETQFRQVSVESSIATTHTLWRILVPPLQAYLIANDIDGVRTAPFNTPLTCFLIGVGQCVIWSSRATLLRHSSTCICVFRIILVSCVFSHPLSIVAAPGRDACLLCIATLLPLVGEGLCYLVGIALSLTTQHVVRVVHENAESQTPKSWVDLCDQVASIISVYFASAAIMCTTLVWRRRTERDRFRNECMEREMVLPGRELCADTCKNVAACLNAMN
mmetsp:Transcript_37880/g.89243  ORF Transcript_37880/g.89243 Transcript_37880/m.89243 type:complete len:882 (-) Transcript_37880:358-3003(-)